MLASRGALAGEGSEMESINDVKDFIDVTLASIDDVEDCYLDKVSVLQPLGTDCTPQQRVVGDSLRF